MPWKHSRARKKTTKISFVQSRKVDWPSYLIKYCCAGGRSCLVVQDKHQPRPNGQSRPIRSHPGRM
jgi:hypothetical protein